MLKLTVLKEGQEIKYEIYWLTKFTRLILITRGTEFVQNFFRRNKI